MAVEKILPGGWKVTKLANFVNSKKGKKPKFVSTVRTEDFNIPYVNIKAFEKNIVDEYTNGEGCVFCEEGDFLMVWDGSRSGYVGKAIKGAIGSTLVKLSFPKEVFQKFAYYFLQSKYIEINTRAKGVGIPHVDPNLVWNYEFLLPPIEEQQQIVDKIEELFSELDKGIENLKAAQQQLKVYRQAVLKSAFEGKLTNENVIKGDLPKGWVLKKLGNVAESCLGKMLDKSKNKGELTPYLGNINVRWNSFNLNNLPKMRIEESELNRFGIIYGDLIICEGGEPGRAAIWKKDNTGIKFQKALHRVRFSEDVAPGFFLFYLNWIASTKQIDKYFTGTTIKHLTGQSLKKIEFPVPPIIEQWQIINEIESRLSVCDKIEETITNSLQQADALRQSILKKAFEGKLVKEQVKPFYKPKNTYFYQMQLLGIVAAASKERGINHGEMTIAKYAYLLDKVYQIPTYYDYKRWHLGPYPPEIKKAINNSKFFTKKDNAIAVKDIDTLTKYINPYTDELNDAVNDLSSIFSAYAGKERSHQIELLATVCKVIEDIQSADLKSVRKSMAEWKIDLATTHFKTKAEKFSEDETDKCLALILNKGWTTSLIHNVAEN